MPPTKLKQPLLSNGIQGRPCFERLRQLLLDLVLRVRRPSGGWDRQEVLAAPNPDKAGTYST